MPAIRVRIAPSPTGALHVGNARAGLFNYLFAKKYGGAFVLRIEDTDLERSDKKYESDIFEGYRWLGITPDESPEIGGPYGPYRQTERTGTYRKHLERLLAGGSAFYCFHSERELEEEKEKLLEAKRPPLHMCEYRTMDPDEAGLLAEAKPDYIIRFKTPAGRTITFHDLIRGDVSFASDTLGDFSIAKKLDVPLYHFAVVVDDEEMRISHVIRGEDHIANTPKHILLIEALGFHTPIYGHLPLLLGTDRSKLSKRHGATSVIEYREAGYLPEALFNFMALLGWNPGGEQEILTREEIIEKFSLEHVQKSGAIFDVQKLDWMNGEYIRAKSVKELTELCRPYLEDFLTPSIPIKHSDILENVGMFNGRIPDEYLEKVIALEQPRLKKLSEIGERAEYFFRMPKYENDLLRWKKMTDAEMVASLEQAEILIAKIPDDAPKNEIEKVFLDNIGTGDRGALLWPLRVALTGKKASPGPFEIIEILGKKEVIKRIRLAKEKLMHDD